VEGKEVSMFQMIDEARADTRDRKTFLYKVGAFVVMMAALGGLVYFFAFVDYSNH
jgi:hypothetical protein